MLNSYFKANRRDLEKNWKPSVIQNSKDNIGEEMDTKDESNNEGYDENDN